MLEAKRAIAQAEAAAEAAAEVAVASQAEPSMLSPSMFSPGTVRVVEVAQAAEPAPAQDPTLSPSMFSPGTVRVTEVAPIDAPSPPPRNSRKTASPTEEAAAGDPPSPPPRSRESLASPPLGLPSSSQQLIEDPATTEGALDADSEMTQGRQRPKFPRLPSRRRSAQATDSPADAIAPPEQAAVVEGTDSAVATPTTSVPKLPKRRTSSSASGKWFR